MGFFSEIRTALNEIFAEFSQDVQFRGKTFKCIIGENGQQEVELESGGFVPNETFTVKFKEADLEDEAFRTYFSYPLDKYTLKTRTNRSMDKECR